VVDSFTIRSLNPPVPPVRAPLPGVLPDRLPDYLPGRIRVLAPEAWQIPAVLPDDRVRTSIPRYALDLRTLDVPIDPDRVRWLAERSAVRALDSRHVHLVTHRTGLHVVDGHHALAAHLATGAETIPVALARAAVPCPA
jgi:hypothetical protein